MDMFIKYAIIALIVAICLCILALGHKAHQYLKAHLSAKDAERLDNFIETLVTAADQLYKGEDDDGSVRLGYVQGMLIEAGYDITDAIRAIIESKVLKLNITQKRTDCK